ncbi:MAG: YheC/YheD family protein [Patescibacteria group bacterium]
MKTLLILYYLDDFDKEVPFEKDYELYDNQVFYEYALTKGVRVVRSSLSSYAPMHNHFSKYWIYKNQKWNKIHDPIKPDVVWDRAWELFDINNGFERFREIYNLSQKVMLFNNPHFNLLMRNKLSQYLVLGKYMPESFFASNRSDLVKLLERINADKLVVKPLFGSGGKDIYIGKNDFFEIQKYYGANISNSFLVQKFIPSKLFSGSVKDFRLVFDKSGNPVYALSRIAGSDSLFTNVAQGATKEHLEIREVSSQIMNIAEAINSDLAVWSNVIYSLDFMIADDDQVYLIEINTIPGYSCSPGKESYFHKYFDALLDFVI